MAKTLTDTEMKVLALSWQCFKSGIPDIDMDKLATLAGYTNTGSCRNTMAGIKKKLAAMSGTDLTATNGENGIATPAKTPKAPKSKTPASAKPKSTASKKRKAGADTEDDEKTAANVKKEQSPDLEEDEDGTAAITQGATPAKSPAPAAKKRATSKAPTPNVGKGRAKKADLEAESNEIAEEMENEAI